MLATSNLQRTSPLPPGRGQAMVEFALVLPIFLTMVLAFVDFGYGVYVYNTLQQAAKEAIRRGMVISNDCGAYEQNGNNKAGSPYGGVQASQTYLTYSTDGTGACTGYGSGTNKVTIVGAVANVAGIMDRPNITVAIDGSAPGQSLASAGATVIVTTSYRHRPIFGYIFNFDVTMSATGTGIVQ